MSGNEKMEHVPIILAFFPDQHYYFRYLNTLTCRAHVQFIRTPENNRFVSPKSIKSKSNEGKPDEIDNIQKLTWLKSLEFTLRYSSNMVN